MRYHIFFAHLHLRCKHLCLEADQCSTCSPATADPGRPLPLPSVSARLASFTPLALSSPPHLASASATSNAVVAGSQRTKANRPVDSALHYLAHPSVSLRATGSIRPHCGILDTAQESSSSSISAISAQSLVRTCSIDSEVRAFPQPAHMVAVQRLVGPFVPANARLSTREILFGPASQRSTWG